jgi:hypothetical protein
MSKGFVKKSLAPNERASCLVSLELFDVRTRTGTKVPAGIRARSCFRRSKPSMRGMYKSVAIKSG